MCTDFMCQILKLNVVVLTFSSRNLASGMCTDVDEYNPNPNIVKSNLCKIDGENLKYNPNPKLLGITLDEQLNFQEHVNMTEKKASRAIQIIREVKGISQISTKKLIELYVILSVL